MSIKLERCKSTAVQTEWKYLAAREGSRRNQLYYLNTRLPAAQVWRSILVEGYSVEQAAEAWDIPVEAVKECVAYSEANEALIRAEAAAERDSAIRKGILREPPPSD